MNPDLDTRIVPDRPLSDDDCFTLWSIALKKGIADATGRPVQGLDCVAPSETDQQEARAWLLDPSMSLALVCGATGVDMAALNDWARQRAASNWAVQ